MASLYDTLKASKSQRFPDYWTLLWGRKLSAKLIKTLTGTLPLTLTAKGGNAVDWTIYGNNEPGKNFVRAITSRTVFGITFTVNSVAGTVTANGTTPKSNASQFIININNPGEPNNTTVPPGNYYFSACPSGGSSASYNSYSWDFDTRARSKQWDDTTTSEIDFGKGNCQVQINGHRQSITLKIAPNYTANNVVFKPMLRKADTSEAFEPYQLGVGERTENGYIVPLSVNGNTVNIPIGNTPLTEGETVSKTSTGVDIELFEGENTVDTTLTNKPEMTIKYK